MKFVVDDGGREQAGYKGSTSDCVVRAISIAGGRPYQEVYDSINELGKASLVAVFTIIQLFSRMLECELELN